MKLNVRIPRRVVMMGVTLSALAWLGGCAQTPTASGPAGSPATVYSGRFESPCVISRPDSLSFMDVLILTPVDAKTVSVGMHKVFYSTDDCKPDTQIGSLEVPTGTMVIDDQVKIGDRLVDKVTLNLPSGPVGVDSKVAPNGKGRIALEGDSIQIYHGKTDKFTIGSTADAGVEKDLRWLNQGRLLVGNPEQPGADGYPAALDEDSVFTHR